MEKRSQEDRPLLGAVETTRHCTAKFAEPPRGSKRAKRRSPGVHRQSCGQRPTFTANAVPLGSGVRRGFRGSRRLRHRRRQSALGALSTIDEYLRRRRYHLAQGQYDSYELFVDWAGGCSASGGSSASSFPTASRCPSTSLSGACSWKTPRSRVLVAPAKGFFPGVFRGAFLLVSSMNPAKPEHRVRVATLRKDRPETT